MKLIDADALKEYIGIGGTETSCKGCKYYGGLACGPCNLDEAPSIDFVCSAIDDAPTVEAEPVRHGHWIIYVISPFDGEDVKCSECGERGCMPGWDYCPNCGAKMDGEIEYE